MKKELMITVQSGDWYDELNDEKSMAYAKRLGIEALDFSIDHIINPGEYAIGKKFPLCDLPIDEFLAHFNPLKEASEKYGVAIGQMHAPFPVWLGDNANTDYMIAVTGKVCALSEYLNCDTLVVHPHYCRDKAERIAINLKMYEALIPAAKKYHVTICLENLVEWEDGKITGPCVDSEETVYLIDTLNEKAGCEVFGLCFDIGHANEAGIRFSEYLKALGNRVKALHIHDNDARSDAHLIPFTQVRVHDWGLENGVDWDDFIAGLVAIDFKRGISFETFRATRILPKEVEEQALSLIVAIGKYFRKRIINGK